MLILKSVSAKLKNNKINVLLGCWNENVIETRGLDFIDRFDFVDSTKMYVLPRDGRHGPVLQRGPATDTNGYYRYLEDGPTNDYAGVDYILIPNTALERGIRIENWHPEFDVDFNIMQNHFTFTREEEDFGESIKNKFNNNYVVFYMSAMSGNTISGHNRLGLFSPKDWVDLGERVYKELGAKILVVGASYDQDYYDEMIKPLIKGKRYWHNYIDQLSIFHSLSLIKNARFLISYQSGLGIVGHYLGTKVAMWWRQYGDSISPYSLISFNEDMAHCWTRPGSVENRTYMPCLYKKHGVKEIMNFIMENSW